MAVNNEKKIIYIWRAILWMAALLTLFWLFWINLVPTGKMILSYQSSSPTSPVSALHPEERVIDLPEDGGSQRFFIDPVYFDVKAPREFDTVTATMTWKNQTQPILELGAHSVRGAWGFVMKPLQNRIIDNLDWGCDQYDDVLFCQKERRYTSLSAFFANPPSSGVVSYHYVLPETVPHDVMNVRTDMQDYAYLIATYTSPAGLGNGSYRRSVQFDWSNFAIHINELSFIISAPELNQGHGQIVIDGIDVELKRDPLDWEGFAEYIKNQARRLKK